MNISLKVLIILTMLSALLTGCYSGWVRYPCQEYKNWNNPECKPPRCEAEGLCTKDLYDIDTWEEIKNSAK